MTIADLAEAAVSGDRRALARLITSIESGEPETAALLDTYAPGIGSPRIGITGPPGAGKSTLVDGLITTLRGQGSTVAVLAIDPSSPITGGALLGDRIRMQGHVSDEGVFIRSMANRGHLGGLSATTDPTLKAMAHAGFDYLMVETVGVGQSEVEVMHLVDVVVLVLTPGWGDDIQADKAGIVEIADIFVINKADLPGAEKVSGALAQNFGDDARPILMTTATTGQGISDLLEAIEDALADD
jgi:LAO/AO transport system kinase